MREPFQKYVTPANEAACELGFADTGAMWRSKYDMPPDAFAAEEAVICRNVWGLVYALVRLPKNEPRLGNSV
jgi:peptidyl-dipeptidase A